MRRPNIGVTPDFSERAGGVGTYELKQAYADAVFKAGGLPWVLPYSEDPTAAEAFLDRVNGLLITGGAFDIPSAAYGEPTREGQRSEKRARTAFETALLKEALRRRVPVLGICGGMQLLNVVLGGTLFQDIQLEIQNAKNHEQSHDTTQPSHPVEVKDGTLLAQHLGKGQLMVNSTHHQAVNRPGENVVVSALSPDGVVEAIETNGEGFAVGVQWHPELLVQTMPLHLGLYLALVQKAKEGRR